MDSGIIFFVKGGESRFNRPYLAIGYGDAVGIASQRLRPGFKVRALVGALVHPHVVYQIFLRERQVGVDGASHAAAQSKVEE